ncbi:FAD-dependent oxidoreductase [Rhodococcus sp. P1Y]|uniref:FAD-dependent oxidoreductase n=1 Tax=Rhodococcus sp. P1Y TaxID=1302308 RepID=UPI000EADAF21|nr:FAD-dependent oxidoreductase [Rhodococcus sp. P1Y]AYJ49324.1 ferredoxin [Rhodococcus sp. P1Y]
MTYLILQSCCNDASCTEVCPVDCIHPTPDEPQFMSAEMLHIDPDTCIDCGACVDECPVDAIRADHEVGAGQDIYFELNAGYFADNPRIGPDYSDNGPSNAGFDFSGTRVAIVGTGPAAFYTALELAAVRGIEIDMYDRDTTPYGLVRSGVAPDHPTTKTIADVFRAVAGKNSVRVHLGVEIGRDVTHDDLMEYHDAVVYATGASGARTLDIPGEDLPGSHAATEFVGWYNGHPDFRHLTFDLSSPRAVVIGNGNVALDVARILTTDPETLAQTDIADHALETLRNSRIREVVVIGRRGPAQARFTMPELVELSSLSGVELVSLPNEVNADEDSAAELGVEATAKLALIRRSAERTPSNVDTDSDSRRIVLRFHLSPVAIRGDGAATGIELARTASIDDGGDTVGAESTVSGETIDSTLIVRSVGYRGLEIPGVPFDDGRGVIPNVAGRVVNDVHDVVSGVYAAGWIKRGPSGVIGSNRKCATDTVRALLDDIATGRIPRAHPGRDELDAFIAAHAPSTIDFSEWTVVDAAEIAAGAPSGRPRIKFVDPDAIREVARQRES